MPMPWTYRHASREWQAFLDDVKEQTGLSSDNMAYTAIDGVLQTFRRRLTAQQGLDFASVLPTVLRAIMIRGWIAETSPVPFAARDALVAEVQALRPHHNLTPANAIEAVAFALWRSSNHRDLTRVLGALPDGARAFWHVASVRPADLEQRII